MTTTAPSMVELPGDWLELTIPEIGDITLWVPNEWERTNDPSFDLLVLGPEENDGYRSNLSISHVKAEGPSNLDAVVNVTAVGQANDLESMVEYEHRSTLLGGQPAVHREYAWVEEPAGFVLYQIQVLSLLDTTGGSVLLEVHATSSAPNYFRYAAMLRRMIDSIAVSSSAAA